MVPLPDASTPIRTVGPAASRVDPGSTGARYQRSPPGSPRAADGPSPSGGPSRRARRSGPSTAWLGTRRPGGVARPACPPDRVWQHPAPLPWGTPLVKKSSAAPTA